MVLYLENISKSFGKRKLFNKLSLKLDAGKIYSLMGANGSGKTTLFNILTGFVRADSGKIYFNNNSLEYKTPAEINQLGIARTFQDLRLINGLSVKENVLIIIEKGLFHIATIEEYKQVDNILEMVSILSFAEHMGGDISFGQQKLLTLGCCLANNPKLLLLDEPIAGIDDKNKEKILNIILGLRKAGFTIFQIEHDLEYIKATSDIVFQLDEDGLKTVTTNTTH